MNRLLWRASCRYLWQHPWQLGLALTGIALGVAVVVGIRLAEHSARAAFDSATRSVVGTATHQVVARAPGLDERFYVRVQRQFRDLSPTPVIDAAVSLPRHGSYTLRLIGIDALVDDHAAVRRGARGAEFRPATLMATPGAAAISAATARALAVHRGDTLEVRHGRTAGTLMVSAIVRAARAAAPPTLADGIAIVDVATAQEILDSPGRLSRIDLRAGNAAGARLRQLRAALPDGAQLVETGTEADGVRRMTDAFYANLTALSLLALLVGMFLIYNTATFLVVQRRGLVGRLRALGVTRWEILAVLLTEAAGIGLAGSVAGMALGVVLARVLLALVARTVNDLYFTVSVSRVELAPVALAGGLVLGIAATVIASLPAALEAASTPPGLVVQRMTLEARTRHRLGRTAAIGIALIVAAAATTAVPSKSLGAGFTALGLLMAGCALLTPAVTVRLTAWLQRLPRGFRSLPRRLALRSVEATLSRTTVAMMALVFATATSIGIGIMIASFRGSVVDWLDNLLRADVYIADTGAAESLGGVALGAGAVAALRALPEVAAASTVRRITARARGQRFDLAAYELPPPARPGFRFRHGAPRDVWSRWERDDVVIVSESCAYHHDLGVGDRLVLAADHGDAAFEIVGVYQDYARERGVVALSRTTFDRHWQDRGYDGIGVYAAPQVSPPALLQAARRALPADARVTLRSNRELKQASLAVFDRTFAVTAVLRWLALVVAFIAILGALLALQLERAREFGVLRALGCDDREIATLVLTHTGVLGFAAGLIAMPVGIMLAAVLVFVINERSFGWTMSLAVPPGILAQTWLLAVVAALGAGILPAVRAARTPPAAALRDE